MAGTNPSWKFLEDWSPGTESWSFTSGEVNCDDVRDRRMIRPVASHFASVFICFAGDNVRVQRYSRTISVTENEPTVPKIEFL